MKFGAREAKVKKKEKEYDYVMDEEIEFVQAIQMPGTAKKVSVLHLYKLSKIPGRTRVNSADH